MSAHGYGRYTNGCRCEVCRKAKADYMRQRRAEARALAQRFTSTPDGKRPNWDNAFAVGASRHLARVARHGTRYAYEEKGCRCRECLDARIASDRRKPSREAAS
jgi:hypothetical protein